MMDSLEKQLETSTSARGKRALFIDLGSVYWQAWHSSANEEVSAAHDRAVSAARRIVSRENADFVAVCCDSPSSWRKDKYADYKANRPEKDKAAIEQLRRTKETLRSDGLLLWECDSFEADDLIATAVGKARILGMEIVIASSDKDLAQLSGPDVTLYSPKTDKFMALADVRERFGVGPAQIRDWLALVGDTSDNVKGVRGIGPKNASGLLALHGDIGGLLRAYSESPATVATPAIAKALGEAIQSGTLKKAIELVTLSTGAPIAFEELFEERKREQLTPVDDTELDEEPEDMNDFLTPIAAPDQEPATETEPKSEPRAVHASEVVDKPQPQSQTQQQKDEEEEQPRTSLAIPDSRQWALALEPSSLKGAWWLAKTLFNSRMFGVASEEAAFAILMAGRSMGIDAVTSLRGFHVIKGKPVMSSTLIVGIVLRSGKARYFRLKSSTDSDAVYETWRKGDPEPVEMSFSMADAKRALLLSDKDSNWTKYPRTMLRHRAAAELARAVYPDVVMNVYTEGELEEEEQGAA